MPTKLTGYKIFVAAPGGLEEERQLFHEVIQEYNESEALFHSVQFIPVRWELMLGGRGRAQGIINQDLRKCDYMVLLLWDRWGSKPDSDPNSSFTSGVEEEYSVAMDCLDDPELPMQDIVVFFRDVDVRRISDPGEQLKEVLKFKSKIQDEKLHFYDTYEKPGDFGKRLRTYLGKWLRADMARNLHETKTHRDNKDVTLVLSRSIKHIPIPGEVKPSSDSELGINLNQAKLLADSGKLVEAEKVYADLITQTRDVWPKNEFAKFLYRTGKRSAAEKLYREILGLAIETNNIGWIGRANANLGIILQSRGDLAQAESHYNTSLDYNTTIGHKEGIADSLRHLSIIHRIHGELFEAIKTAQKSLDLYEELEDPDGTADTLSDLGVMYRISGDLDTAEEHYLRALEINKAQQRRACIADEYGYLGTISRIRGNIKQAEKYYVQAKEINEELDRKQGLAEDLGHLGVIDLIRSKPKNALQYFQRALDINESLDFKEGIAKQCSNLARAYWSTREYRQAESKLSQALQINKELGAKEGLAAVYYNFGSLYLFTQDYVQAEAMTMQAMNLNREMGCKEGLAYNYLQQANIKKECNNFTFARELCLSSLDISVEKGFGLAEAESHYTLGIIEIRSGNEIQAEIHLKTARQRYLAMGLKSIVKVIDSLLT